MATANAQARHPVMIVDDDRRILRLFERYLGKHGFEDVRGISDPREVVPAIAARPPDLVLLDLCMPHVTGQDLLETLSRSHPEIPVIVITANADIQTVVLCMKTGAIDYLEKPIQEGALLSSVRQALQIVELRRENATLKACMLSSRLECPEAFDEIVTRNDAMLRAFRYTEAISTTSQPVLITGETGTGKELVARAIHRLSGRKGRFVSVNASGLDDEVFADTLFGHRPGAYTGAQGGRVGLVRQADGGTLFLDEIGHLPAVSQVKLLRFLQEHEYLPLGADDPERSDARIVAATNVPSHELQSRSDFRNDLFFRLCAHHVHMPALRERPDDVEPLLEHFLREACTAMERSVPFHPPELVLLLRNHSFPGNVRELRSMVFDAIGSHGNGILSMERFVSAIERAGGTVAAGFDAVVEGEGASPSPWMPEDGRMPTLKEAEAGLIEEALRRSGGNQSIAARLLGISRQALNKRLSRRSRKA